MSKNIKLAMFFLILFSNLTFFVYWIVKMIQELRIMIIKKYERLYLFLFLCGQKKRLNAVKDKIDYDEVNEILREDFLN